MKTIAVLSLIAVAALVRCPAAPASNSSDFYFGAAVGQATVRENELAFPSPGIPLGFSEHHAGWKVMFEVRPVALLGVELEYIDFGSPSELGEFFGNTTGLRIEAHAHPKAGMASGIFYVPVPMRFLELYGKAGVARLHKTVSAQVTCIGSLGDCPPTRYFPPLDIDRTNTEFAYGVGLQANLRPIAIRIEYQRINAPEGDPQLLSLGLLWAF